MTGLIFGAPMPSPSLVPPPSLAPSPMPSPSVPEGVAAAQRGAAQSPRETQQLQRYYAVLRDFMAHLHGKAEIYPPSHEFSQQELGVIGPRDIVKWMNAKLYNTEDPQEHMMPLNGSHHTLDYYMKSISHFMPEKDRLWDPESKKGNPTRSGEVHDLLQRVKDFDAKDSGGRKRWTLATAGAPTPLLPPAPASAKRARTAPPPGRASAAWRPAADAARGGPPSREGAALQRVLRTMHAQNAAFIDAFAILSRSLEAFQTTLQCNNLAILNEIANLDAMAMPSSAVPPGSDAVGAGGEKTPPSGTVAGGTAAVGSGMLDWHYVHADGVRRRVPPTWTFPHCNLHDLYLLWHCGDYQNRISPMKLFQSSDLCLNKRARLNLNEVKHLMATIDDEATRKGTRPTMTMTSDEADACFHSGVSGFKFSVTTPTGKKRDIMRLKWSTLTKYNKSKKALVSTLRAEAEAEVGDEQARLEFVVPDDEDAHDHWWYKHEDGVKRRVPSTWKFPMLGLEGIYVYWHCGDEAQKISPMKLFQLSDLFPGVKRAKANMSEVRLLVTLVDAAAAKKGKTIKAIMTPAEAKECCHIGYPSLNIPPTKLSGQPREVLHMKWSTAVRLKNAIKEGALAAGKAPAAKDALEAEEAELSEAEIEY